MTCAPVEGFPTCFHAGAGTACPGVQTCQGAGVCTCPTTACTGLADGTTLCGPNGGEQTCTADAQSCLSLGAEVACADVAGGAAGLVCNAAAGAAGHCDCSTTDSGTVQGGFCAVVGMQVCETGGANGENNVLVCGNVMLGSHLCQAWSTFGGAGGMGDCHGAGVTCDPVAHECACPAHSGNVWFANPPTVTDRTLFHQLGLVETGVQGADNPPTGGVCAFETATVALQHAKDQVNSGAAAGATVVLAGGRSPFQPAIYNNETWPMDIPDGIRMTVDTDTTTVGINPPQGVLFDPRNEILVFTSAGLNPGGHAVGLTQQAGAGGSIHGITIAGGPCGAAFDQDCSPNTNVVALSVAEGSGVRADSMLLEGGGGRVIDTSTAAAPNPGALAVGTQSVTMTFAQSDSDIRGDLENARFILVNGASTLSHDGVFRITNVAFPDADTVAVTYFTNVPGLAADTAATWAISAQGPLGTGLEVGDSGGSFNAIMAENFWNVDSESGSSGTGILVDSTAAGGITFSGLYVFNNVDGFDVNGGTVTIANVGIPAPPAGFITTFAHAVDQPIIEHNLFTGLDAAGTVVTANNLRVFNTQDDPGVFADSGELHLIGGSIDSNNGGGLDIDGADFVTADSTLFSSNIGDGVDVDDVGANATFTNTKMDSNTNTGLVNNGNLVFVFGGANTTINSNNLGVNLNGGTINVNTVADLTSVGVVNVSSNNQQGIIASSGTLNVNKAEVDSNSVNSSLDACDDTHAQEQMAISVTGTATLTLNASAVQVNNGGGLFVNSSNAATISSSTISSNSVGLPNCGDFDGIEALSAVNFTGAIQSNVQTNHGNGIHVHSSGILTTAGGGVNVASNDFDGILIDETGSVTLGATDVVATNCQTGGSAGIEVNGGLTATGTTVSGNLCDGILVDQFGPQTKLTGITSTLNTGDGVHITNAPNNGETVDDDSEAPVADSDMGVQIIGGSIITSNTLNGVEIGGGDQDASIYVLVANSFIDSNTGAGVLAVGGDDDGSAATFLSLVSNVIVANKGPGLDDTGAHLRAATISGTDNAGFSKNDIEHNGFASETQCLSGETFGQIVFHGALVQLEGAQCSAFNSDVNACEDGTNATHCIFNSTTSQCFHAYWLQGGTTDTCDQQNTNIISGYAGETSTNQTGASVVGVNAVGGAAVNASGNTWKHSSPALTIDIANDAASFVKRVGACQAHNTCIPAPH